MNMYVYILQTFINNYIDILRHELFLLDYIVIYSLKDRLYELYD